MSLESESGLSKFALEPSQDRSRKVRQRVPSNGVGLDGRGGLLYVRVAVWDLEDFVPFALLMERFAGSTVIGPNGFLAAPLEETRTVVR